MILNVENLPIAKKSVMPKHQEQRSAIYYMIDINNNGYITLEEMEQPLIN